MCSTRGPEVIFFSRCCSKGENAISSLHASHMPDRTHSNVSGKGQNPPYMHLMCQIKAYRGQS